MHFYVSDLLFLVAILIASWYIWGVTELLQSQRKNKQKLNYAKIRLQNADYCKGCLLKCMKQNTTLSFETDYGNTFN